ncbi:peptidase inhibitor family I36 protein [Nonomuraea sp. NPDC050202]|uniref:peptidase inhibitor family I36 protein n=1 Tax=Nonomuraea sp. NPDC050202 TaxID=3155035 RepID=UPI0033CCCF0F
MGRAGPARRGRLARAEPDTHGARSGERRRRETGGRRGHWERDLRPGRFCIWGDMNYEGRRLTSSGDAPNVGDWINDMTTSFWNRTNKTYCMYQHVNYGYLISWKPANSTWEWRWEVKPGGSSPYIGLENDVPAPYFLCHSQGRRTRRCCA